MDSLRFGAVEIGRIIAPDRRQHRQEAPKRILATSAWFFGFSVGLMWRGGVGGRLCSFQTPRWVWGALKDKIHLGGQKPPGVSTCFPGPTALKLPRESNRTPWGWTPSKSGT